MNDPSGADEAPLSIFRGTMKKPKTCKPVLLTYADAVEDAARRLHVGEKQIRCACCQKWRWKHEAPVPFEQ